MNQEDRLLITMRDGKEFLIECINKEEPFYTYHHTFIVATTYMLDDIDLLAGMATAIMGGYDNAVSGKNYDAFRERFAPYYKGEFMEKRDKVQTFKLTITFPYMD